jgi:hypothetical protein
MNEHSNADKQDDPHPRRSSREEKDNNFINEDAKSKSEDPSRCRHQEAPAALIVQEPEKSEQVIYSRVLEHTHSRLRHA